MPKNAVKNKVKKLSYEELILEQEKYKDMITKSKNNLYRKDLIKHLKRVEEEIRQYKLNMYRKKGFKYENKSSN